MRPRMLELREAQVLKIGPGARVDSLGGAFGAIANDVTTIYWKSSRVKPT